MSKPSWQVAIEKEDTFRKSNAYLSLPAEGRARLDLLIDSGRLEISAAEYLAETQGELGFETFSSGPLTLKEVRERKKKAAQTGISRRTGRLLGIPPRYTSLAQVISEGETESQAEAARMDLNQYLLKLYFDLESALGREALLKQHEDYYERDLRPELALLGSGTVSLRLAIIGRGLLDISKYQADFAKVSIGAFNDVPYVGISAEYRTPESVSEAVNLPEILWKTAAAIVCRTANQIYRENLSDVRLSLLEPVKTPVTQGI
ncbi:MAG: hypothetical protein V1820_00935 [archaeon]